MTNTDQSPDFLKWKHLGNGPGGFDHYGLVLHQLGYPIERNYRPNSPGWIDPLGEGEPLHDAYLELPGAFGVSTTDPQIGDILIFRMELSSPALHSGILVHPGVFYHAPFGRSPVRTRLVPWWQRRLAFAIRSNIGISHAAA